MVGDGGRDQVSVDRERGATLVPEFAAMGLGKAITQVVIAIGADRLYDILQTIYITKLEGQKWTRRG